MIKKLLASAAAAGFALTATTALAADAIKIGVITTLTTPAAVLGNEQMNGFNLAMKHLGGKAGGLDIDLIAEDDGFKPDVGKQKAEKLVKQDDVDIVTGLIWSHVMLASTPTILKAGKFAISANAGHSKLAGKNCDENFFNASWQNDTVPMALGHVLNSEGMNSVYIMAPNYAAGKDMANGVAATFKGEVLGKDLTKWGKDAQLDFSAELAKAKASGADALFVFYPGKAGGAFMKQFGQAGLGDHMKLFTVFTVDGISLPKFQAAGMNSVLGSVDTMHWNVDFDNDQNKRFVADFRAEHGRYPSFYAAQAYDTMFMIDAAVAAVGGDLSNQDGMRAAFKSANYASVRGDFSYGDNHFPVQNFYLREVVEGDDGAWVHKTKKVVLENFVDPHAGDCSM